MKRHIELIKRQKKSHRQTERKKVARFHFQLCFHSLIQSGIFDIFQEPRKEEKTQQLMIAYARTVAIKIAFCRWLFVVSKQFKNALWTSMMLVFCVKWME
jgi:hypothetical protein